ncbi:hypothetical protein HPB49_003251 [Dermacentor silvarum]|uniref:Uncharacterized protein n=1 Tax=Dermacentor silvarum TaxID=543639 RepID=A0ACB8C177_DERSI|nr:hypothetical protein HPB49_003251 [Dermacentor silvarum]
MGKTQMLLLTFDTPHPLRRLSLDYEIVPVYEHRPRALACFRCHGLGHMAKFCPSPAKIRKERELIHIINWSHFRESVGDKFESIEEFAQLMRDNLSSANEETLGEEDEGVIDSRMITLWKKANKLTRKYKTNGRRYQTPRRIRGIFELIRQHGEDLSRVQWVSTCERPGKINGMKQLWGILRNMLGKGRGQSPLETLTLRHGADNNEEEIIKPFFPHASTTPPAPL